MSRENMWLKASLKVALHKFCVKFMLTSTFLSIFSLFSLKIKNKPHFHSKFSNNFIFTHWKVLYVHVRFFCKFWKCLLSMSLQEMVSSVYLFTIAKSLGWGHPCQFVGVFLAPGFYLTPKCTPIKTYFSLLSPSSFLLPAQSFMFLSLPVSPHPILSLLRRSPLFPLHRGTLMSVFVVIYPLWGCDYPL